MAEVLARESVGTPVRVGAVERLASPDERLARAELRRQIGRLELEIARLTHDGFGRLVVPHAVAAAAPAPRLLDLGELERLRDALAERAGEARDALAEKAASEAATRQLLRRMIDSPGDYRWLRISRADVGEPACGHWHSRPRLGPIGMLMGWWRVKVSSGCPSTGRLAAAIELEVEAPPLQAAAKAGRPRGAAGARRRRQAVAPPHRR